MDTLDVGDGAMDGLSDEEKQSAITIWAMANSPLYLGGDLTKLDVFAREAFTNDELLAVDQAGHPATQLSGGSQPVWVSKQPDGSMYVALYNLNGLPAKLTIPWRDLGFRNAAAVRDVWNRIDLGPSPSGFTTTVLGHGSRLLKVIPSGAVPTGPVLSYEAESATLNGTATISQCPACSGGSKVSYLGASPLTNTVTFNQIHVTKDGTYRMQVDAMTQGPRALIYSVNSASTATLNLGGGSFNLPQTSVVPVMLKAGNNSITFGNPGTYAADLDRIRISGDGNAPPLDFTTYEAEAAELTGTSSMGGCSFCSGGAYVGSFGDGSQNTVTFRDVSVSTTGTYQLDVEYTTSGPRTFFVSVNDGPSIEIDGNGSTFDSPVTALLTVPLSAGKNKIVFSNPNPGGYAPGLDSITIGPAVGFATLQAVITHKAGTERLRVWQFTLNNSGNMEAKKARINSFSLSPVSKSPGCKATPLLATPLAIGTIPPGSTKTIEVPVVFSSLCRNDITYRLNAVFSADNGASVGSLDSTETH